MARERGASDAEVFERHRVRLFGIAYRMLGSVEDAEDVVQECFLRWDAADPTAVRSPEAWLVAVTTRLAIDRLRRVVTERKHYAGHWLPEPIATAREAAADRGAEMASDLSMAFLVLLERLAPEERAALLLRDVFDADYGEIARVLERSEAACRQLVHRARVRVRGERTRFSVPPETHERLLERFLAALGADDQEALLALRAEGTGPDAACDHVDQRGAVDRHPCGGPAAVHDIRRDGWGAIRGVLPGAQSGEAATCGASSSVPQVEECPGTD
jgi:RNA polymerase sigma-70 factor (ECF subfamily)